MLHPCRSSNRNGFTLLEVIVALTLIATLGITLFSWIYTSLANIHRTERLFQEEAATTNALAWLSTVNPLLQPKGTVTIGDISVSWQSSLIAPIRQCQAPYSLNKSIYQTGLYSLQVTVSEGERHLSSFSVHKAGWIQTGAPPETKL